MLEKIRKLTKRMYRSKIGMNYIWVFLGQNTGSVFTMITLVLTLRIISSEEYGAMVAIQTYSLLISNVFCIRSFNGIVKYITDYENKKEFAKAKKYINTSFLLDAISGIGAFVLGLILIRPLTMLMGWDAEKLQYAFIYLPVVFFLPLLHGTPVGILRQLGRFKQVNIIHAITYGIQCLVMCVTLIMNVGNFFVVLIEYAVTSTLEGIFLTIYCFYEIQKREEYKNFWREGISRDITFIKYNLYCGISISFDQILGHGTTLILNRFAGNLTTAYIKVITQICSIISKFTNPIAQVVYPELCSWIAKKEYQKAYKVSIKYFYIVCGCGALLMGGLFVSYDWWIGIFDPGMAGAKMQSVLYMAYSLFSVSIICTNQLVFALNLVKKNMYIIITFNMLYLIALIPAIKSFGVYGYLVLQLIQLVCAFAFKLIFIKAKIKKTMTDKRGELPRKSIVLMTGGLGNQLFQYTFMVYLKKKMKNDIAYNCSNIDFLKCHSGFQADLVFDFSGYDKNNRNFYNSYYRIIRKIKKILKNNKSLFFCNDDMFTENKTYPVYEGFWQKTKFYEAVKPELKDALKDLSIYCSETTMAEKMKETESVFLHIRRGDYCKDPRYVDLSKTEYYQNAINYYNNLYEKPTFFVFSDDIPWCREYFKDNEQLVFVEYKDQSALSDLYLMHQCKNAIIANSSFSWWGAALDTKKVVVRPTEYNVLRDIEGLYPKEWAVVGSQQQSNI